MNYAIISAGEGSRLKQEGISTPKPLVKINGVPLIERLINIFLENNAESISIIVNDLYPEVYEFIKCKQDKITVPLKVIRKTTPSSFHSLYELSSLLKNKKFCLTTVDTVFKENEFRDYISKFESDDSIEGLFGVTTFIDDEKPLYVETDENYKIINFLDENTDGKCTFASGGIYCFSPKVIKAIEEGNKNNISRMRNFQRMLIENNYNLKAYNFSKIIDIDHSSDIEKAEAMINTERKL